MRKLLRRDLVMWAFGTAAAFTVFYNALRVAEQFWGLGQAPRTLNENPRLATAGRGIGEVGPRYLSTDEAMQDAELRDYAEQGMKIHAIKRYRELTGAGLKEAKDAVETHLF